jgi:hypothetical protein
VKKILLILSAVAAALLLSAGVAYATITMGPGSAPQIDQSTACRHIDYTQYDSCWQTVKVTPTSHYATVVYIGKWRCTTRLDSANVVRTYCSKP